MFKQLTLSLLALLLLLPGASLVAAEAAGTPAAKASQKPQPLHPKVFQFTDRSGETIELLISERGIKLLTPKGKSAILMFYIYSGTPCRHELQLFSKLAPEYKDLAFITFELKGLKADAFPAFENELGIKGLHMIDSAQALPFAQFLAKLIRWPGSVPLIIAIDKKGEVKHMQLGAMNEEELKKLIATLNG